MSFTRTAVAAAVALAMTSAPVLAQSAAPLSVAASVERSGAPIEGANNLQRDYMFAFGFFAIAVAAILLLGSKDGGDLPASA